MTTKTILDKDSKTILEDLGIKGLSPEEEREVSEALLDHFSKVIVETAVLEMDENERKKFEEAVKKENFEEEIIKITAGVPGLAGKIEEAVAREFELIKASYASN